MYHYGCSTNDLKEQKNAFQLALNALLSMNENSDRTDRLFIYPINSEYNVQIFLSSSLNLCLVLVHMSIESKSNIDSIDWRR